MTRRGLLTLALIVGMALAAAGCKQSQGDRCQVDSDCESGLVCFTGQSQSVPPEGQCQPAGLVVQEDAGVTPQPDAPVQADAALDAAAADDAAADAAPADDAAAGDDAATD